ncbi:hypothetical protein H2248_005287 [Termitomyces sp. 'cryptogamus']|nr:hypothetical protein H2248_005287 [Termitomyces sp. 'cryptogamus']
MNAKAPSSHPQKPGPAVYYYIYGTVAYVPEDCLIEVTVTDDRVVEADVPPLEAAFIIELFSRELPINTPSAPDLPPIQSVQQQAEQMKVYRKFIEGMLTNLGALPLYRIQTMLRYAPGYDRTIEQLAGFMEAARREGLVIECVRQWRLKYSILNS